MKCQACAGTGLGSVDDDHCRVCGGLGNVCDKCKGYLGMTAEGELCDECVDNEVDTNNGEDVIFNKGT